jgi:predicted component of type VI protein secretion system
MVPDELTDEERMAQMEVNIKALKDYDPNFIPGFDMGRLKKSMAYMNKVKVGY